MAIDPSLLINSLLQNFTTRASAVGPERHMASLAAAPAPAPEAAPPYYLAQPNAPLSYMMPGSPLNAPDPNAEAAARVSALINGMESQPMPAPPRHRGPGNKILGILGDALTNYGSVRAGGPVRPVGPYTEGVQGERLRFENASDEATKNNAAIRNQMRLAAYQNEERRVLAKTQGEYDIKVAQERSLPPKLRGVPTTIVDPKTGQNVRVVDWYDPVSGSWMGRDNQGEAGYAPAVMPFNIIGEDGQPRATIGALPKNAGGRAREIKGPGGATIEPQAPSALASEAGGKGGVLSRIPDVIDVFDRAAEAVGGDEGYFNRIGNWLQSKAANKGLGKMVGAPPELRDYYNSVKAVLFPIVKVGSGVNFSYQELDRWESRFPIPGYDSPDESKHAWDVLIAEMVTDVKSKYAASGRTPPPISDPRAKEDFSQKPPMARKTFESMMASEQKRWTDGGGKVGQ